MWDFFKGLKLNTILIVVSAVLLVFLLRQCNRTSNLKSEAKIAEMNQAALLDSVTSYKSKNGTLVFEKSTLIASKNDLKDLNKELYDEVKNLKKNPKVIFKERVEVRHDTVKVPTSVVTYPDGSIGLKWKHDTTYSVGNFQRLAGETKFKYLGDSLNVLGTSINENVFGISLVTGLTKGKDTYEIFVKSDYPGFTVTNIDGAIIDKDMVTSNESALVFGPHVGYGIMFGENGTFRHGVEVGIGLTYNLNKPIKKIFRPFGL